MNDLGPSIKFDAQSSFKLHKQFDQCRNNWVIFIKLAASEQLVLHLIVNDREYCISDDID